MSKFKVGDRVVEDKYVGGADLVEHWNEYWKSAGPFEGAFYVTGLLHSGDEVSYSNKPGGNGPICPARYLKLAPRFAVGDKVRAVRDSIGGGYTKGKTYVVKTCRDNHITTEFDDSGSRTNGWGADNFEPAYTSCAAAEVDNLADEYGGGKAMRLEAGKSYVGDDGKTYGPFRTFEYGGGSFILEIGDGNIWGADGKHGEYNVVKVNMVAVAPATATLTIRAGAYYKTRDGRKVGPMEVHLGSHKNEHPWSGSLDREYNGARHSFIFKQDGRNYEYTALDLIAEWSDDVPLRGVSPVAQSIAKTVVAPATTAKFKVGDRVKFRDDYDADCRGKEATVVEVNKWGVQVDQGIGIKDLSTEQPKDLVLLPATTIADIVRKHSGTAVVMLLENGQPKPSTLPFVHLNKDAAATEAARLAGSHKGQEFGVYECVDVRKVERVYDHEWQRLAARGSKIPAIKAYRDAGGKRETFVSSEFGYRAGYENRFVIGLKEAKDAVEYWLATAA